MLGIALAAGYTAVFIFLIRKLKFFETQHASRLWISIVFLLKVCAGTGLWFVYTRMYPDRSTADIFKYFDDGKVIYNALFTHPADYFKMLFGISDPSLDHYYRDDMAHWSREFNQGLYNENRTLIRFNGLIDLFSLGNYHVHTVFICFLSIVGLTGIFKSFSLLLAGKRKELFAVVFLLPSVLFWGSGVLKESLVLFSLGMCVYHYFKLIREPFSFLQLLWTILFLILLSFTKLYMTLVLLPGLIANFWISKTRNSYPELKYLTVLIMYFSAGLLLPKYDFPFMLMEKQRQAVYMAQGGSYLTNQRTNQFIYVAPTIKDRIIRIQDKPGFARLVPGVPYVAWNLSNFLDSAYIQHSTDTSTLWVYYDQEAAGSFIQIPMLNGTMLSIINNSPVAFANTFLRPWLFEAKNPLMLFSAVENTIIIIVAIFCIMFCYRNIPYRHMIYFCFSISFLLFALIGLTTPVLGAAVRYKIPALPFILIAFLLLLDKEKLMNKFPVLRKILG